MNNFSMHLIIANGFFVLLHSAQYIDNGQCNVRMRRQGFQPATLYAIAKWYVSIIQPLLKTESQMHGFDNRYI